jgi:hypothetical protein
MTGVDQIEQGRPPPSIDLNRVLRGAFSRAESGGGDREGEESERGGKPTRGEREREREREREESNHRDQISVT